MVSAELIDLAYLIASVLFIMALKGLSHPRYAVRGNLYGAIGMLIATVAVMLSAGLDYTWIIIGMVIGTAAGIWYAVKTKMTAMPQLVALLNGYGGGSSLLVAGVELALHPEQSSTGLIATAASGLIGAVTFSGSFVAWAKLEEMKIARDLRLPGQQALNGLLVASCLAISTLLFYHPQWIAL